MTMVECGLVAFCGAMTGVLVREVMNYALALWFVPRRKRRERDAWMDVLAAHYGVERVPGESEAEFYARVHRRAAGLERYPS